jgi:hypothetical protein
MVNEAATLESSTTNLPNSPNRPKKTMVPLLLAYLYFSLAPYQRLSRTQQGEREVTFMTSKGCVTNVAMAPAAAAEKLCTSAEFMPELGGTKRSAGNVNRVNEGAKRESNLFLV